MRSQKGLTLMELLIVTAIVAALAALLFPVFQSVRKAAYMTGCRSNMKQIYQALKLYEEDYGEFFYKPPDRDQLFRLELSKSYPIECDLARALYPYTKDTSIFVCPAFPKPEGFCREFRPDLPPMSYIYNYAFARWKGHPITSNLVCHFCTMHAEWREAELPGDVTLIFLSPTLVCLMDGSIHLYYPPVPSYLDRPFTYP